MKKSPFWLLVIFVLLSTYNPKFSLIPNFNLNIKKIIIENNSTLSSNEIKQEINFLYDQNLLFLKRKEIEESLKKLIFIESYSIKKIYPNKIKLIVVEKKPLAILFNKREKFYIIDDGSLIKFTDLEIYKDLPTVFGGSKTFYSLYNKIQKIKFPLETIKSFYFFESGRWDLVMHDNKLVKLPIKELSLSLRSFMKLKKNNDFNKYKTFDFRIKDQLILN